MFIRLSSNFLPILSNEIKHNFKNRDISYIIGILNSFPEHNYQELLCSFKKKVNINVYDKNYHKFKIYNNNNFEIYIINWNRYSYSPIHNHSKNGCVMKVLDGALRTKIL